MAHQSDPTGSGPPGSNAPIGGSVAHVPIIDVELVGEARVTAELSQRLADVLGEALSSRRGGAWVRVRQLAADHYAENGGLEEGVLPVFVTVLERNPPTGPDLVDRIRRITTGVAAVTGRDPDHVHVLYDAAAAGRLAFGGRLVE